MHIPIRVLFLSDGNSARSQMAEALLRSIGGDRFAVHSAGLCEPQSLHPLAVQVMAEIDLDISGQRGKHLNEYLDTQFDYIITLRPRQGVLPNSAGKSSVAYALPRARLSRSASTVKPERDWNA